MENRKAILLIHGFGGSPVSLEYLSKQLLRLDNSDVFTFLLPGHILEDDRVVYQDFISSACEHILFLINKGYKDIYVVGHSMGGILACYVASKFKEIKKLVLVSPAFHYLEVKGDDVDLLGSLKSGVNILKDASFNDLFSKSNNVSPKMVLEFIHLVKYCYDTPKFVDVPTLIVWGTLDYVVPFSSVMYVFENLKSKCKSLLVVKGVSHNPFVSLRREEVASEVVKFFKDIHNSSYVVRKDI